MKGEAILILGICIIIITTIVFAALQILLQIKKKRLRDEFSKLYQQDD